MSRSGAAHWCISRGASSAEGGVATLLRAGHVGDGQAPGEAQEFGGGSVGVVLRGLLHPPVLRLELVQRRLHRTRVLPLGAAIHVYSARPPHDAVLPGPNTGHPGVFAHVPVILPTAPWVALSNVG